MKSAKASSRWRCCPCVSKGTLGLSAGAFVCSFVALQIKLLPHSVPAAEITFVSSVAGWLLTTACLLIVARSTPAAAAAGGLGPTQRPQPQKQGKQLHHGLSSTARILPVFVAAPPLASPAAAEHLNSAAHWVVDHVPVLRHDAPPRTDSPAAAPPAAAGVSGQLQLRQPHTRPKQQQQPQQLDQDHKPAPVITPATAGASVVEHNHPAAAADALVDIDEEGGPSYSSSRSSSSSGGGLHVPTYPPGLRGLLAAFQDAVWPGDSSLLLLLLLRGLFGAIAVGGLYAGVGMLPLQTAVTLFFCTPAFAVLFDFLMAPRSIQLPAVVSCALTVLGVVLVNQPSCPSWGGHGGVAPVPSPASSSPAAAAAAGAVGVSPPPIRVYVESAWTQQASSMGDSPAGFEPHPAAAAAAASAMGRHLLTHHGVLQLAWVSSQGAAVALVLLAAAANAAAFVTASSIGPRVSSLVVTWWYHTVVCGASLTVLVLTSPGSIWETSGSSWLLLAGIAAANFAGQLMLNYGFQRMEASIGSAVNTAQVLYSYVWDLTVLQHVVRPCAVAGSAAIVVGVVCAALGKRKGGSDAAEGEEEGGEGEGDDPEVTQRLLAS